MLTQAQLSMLLEGIDWLPRAHLASAIGLVNVAHHA